MPMSAASAKQAEPAAAAETCFIILSDAHTLCSSIYTTQQVNGNPQSDSTMTDRLQITQQQHHQHQQKHEQSKHEFQRTQTQSKEK